MTQRRRAPLTGVAARARNQRRRATPAEYRLWCHLRQLKLAGVIFHRHRTLGRSIVTFYSPGLSLAIELLESDPLGTPRDAAERSALERCGVRFIDLGEEEIEENLPAVLERIRDAVRERLAIAEAATPREAPCARRSAA